MTPEPDTAPMGEPGLSGGAAVPGNRGPARGPGFRIVLAIGLVYLATLAFLPLEGFWVVDSGNKYLQLQALLRSGYASAAIPWPGLEVDPELRFNPLPSPFSVVRDGRLYSVFCPVFALVSSVPFRLLGFAGLYLLPLCGGLAILAAVWTLGGRIRLAPPARMGAVALAGLGSPVWFYSVVFWEHAPAVGCALWALVLLLGDAERSAPPRAAGGALLAALAVYLRDDLLLFLPVALCVLLARLPAEARLPAFLRFTGAACAALAPLGLVNLHYTGHPAGFHIAEHVAGSSPGLLEHFSQRWLVFDRLFLAQHREPVLSLFLSLPCLAAAVLGPRLGPAAFRTGVPVLALLGSAGFAVSFSAYFSAEGPLLHVLHSNSLFGSAPFLVLALLDPGEGGAGAGVRRLLRRACLGFALLYWLAAPWIASYPLNWGSRYLLLLYPLLALFCAANLQAWAAAAPVSRVSFGRRPPRAAAWAVGGLLLASVVCQGYGVHLLYRAQEWSDRFNRVVAARPEEVVLTNSWSVPQDLHRVFLEKPVFLVTTAEGGAALREALAAAGYRSALLIERSALAGPPPPDLPVTVIPDGGLRLREVRHTSTALQ